MVYSLFSLLVSDSWRAPVIYHRLSPLSLLVSIVYHWRAPVQRRRTLRPFERLLSSQSLSYPAESELVAYLSVREDCWCPSSSADLSSSPVSASVLLFAASTVGQPSPTFRFCDTEIGNHQILHNHHLRSSSSCALGSFLTASSFPNCLGKECALNIFLLSAVDLLGCLYNLRRLSHSNANSIKYFEDSVGTAAASQSDVPSLPFLSRRTKSTFCLFLHRPLQADDYGPYSIQNRD